MALAPFHRAEQAGKALLEAMGAKAYRITLYEQERQHLRQNQTKLGNLFRVALRINSHSDADIAAKRRFLFGTFLAKFHTQEVSWASHTAE